MRSKQVMAAMTFALSLTILVGFTSSSWGQQGNFPEILLRSPVWWQEDANNVFDFLYQFLPDGRGARTQFVGGTPLTFVFAWWQTEHNQIVMRFPSGFTQAVDFIDYYPQDDLLDLFDHDIGRVFWCGCSSACMPSVVQTHLCGAR